MSVTILAQGPSASGAHNCKIIAPPLRPVHHSSCDNCHIDCHRNHHQLSYHICNIYIYMLSPPSTIQSFACFCQINEVCRFCTHSIQHLVYSQLFHNPTSHAKQRQRRLPSGGQVLLWIQNQYRQAAQDKEASNSEGGLFFEYRTNTDKAHKTERLPIWTEGSLLKYIAPIQTATQNRKASRGFQSGGKGLFCA